MHKISLQFAPVVELSKLNFTHITVCTEIAKAGPGFHDSPEHPSVQINSSSPCTSLPSLMAIKPKLSQIQSCLL